MLLSGTLEGYQARITRSQMLNSSREEQELSWLWFYYSSSILGSHDRIVVAALECQSHVTTATATLFLLSIAKLHKHYFNPQPWFYVLIRLCSCRSNSVVIVKLQNYKINNSQQWLQMTANSSSFNRKNTLTTIASILQKIITNENTKKFC